MSTRIIALTAVAVIFLGSVACGEDPFRVRWEVNPTEATLFSLAQPDVNLPSAFDFVGRRTVQIESAAATGRWDIAVDGNGIAMFLLPPGALGVTSRAGIATIPGASFDEVREAPSDTTRYASAQAVPLELGSVFVVRTRQEQNQWGQVCVFYAKLEPLEINATDGIVTFVFDASPECNNRRLVPSGN